MKPNKETPLIIYKNSINEQICTLLRDRILTQEYSPGERIYVERLEKELQVSRTPIKDAFNQLMGEGLVEVVPRKGTFVVKLLPEELEEIFDIRLMIETHAAELSLNSNSQREIRAMREILIECPQLIKERNCRLFIEEDQKFHHLIVKMSKNTKLYELYKNLNVHIQIARNYYLSDYERLEPTQKEHERILDALTEKDMGLIKEVITTHVMNIKRFVYSKMKQHS